MPTLLQGVDGWVIRNLCARWKLEKICLTNEGFYKDIQHEATRTIQRKRGISFFSALEMW